MRAGLFRSRAQASRSPPRREGAEPARSGGERLRRQEPVPQDGHERQKDLRGAPEVDACRQVRQELRRVRVSVAREHAFDHGRKRAKVDQLRARTGRVHRDLARPLGLLRNGHEPRVERDRIEEP